MTMADGCSRIHFSFHRCIDFIISQVKQKKKLCAMKVGMLGDNLMMLLIKIMNQDVLEVLF